MAQAFNKLNPFVEDMAEGVHNLGSDQLKVALTNTEPSATDDQLSDITEISYTNCSSRDVTTSSSAQTSGTYKLVLADLTLTASGGTVGPFQYAVLYNDAATNDELIGYYDYGTATTLNDGDEFEIDFDGSNGVLTLA
ncbi:MAG TPA: hypothetical protein VJ907_04665 [Halanaerobiales bacterium]|nr:hypothetical protein [Halanaerobiales bacterium]